MQTSFNRSELVRVQEEARKRIAFMEAKIECEQNFINEIENAIDAIDDFEGALYKTAIREVSDEKRS